MAGDELKGWENVAEPSFREVWDNDEDEVWNEDTGFTQDPPAPPSDPFASDRLMQEWLDAHVPKAERAPIVADLARWAERCTTECAAYAEDAEAQEPELVRFDPWGRRVDRIVVAEGWQALDAVSAEEGLVGLAYARRQGEWSRVHQALKLILFHPHSAIYDCPLAMTDGAARLCEVHGDDWLVAEVLPHLVSTDPDTFWTSGQWMTEKTGGSDVSRSETVARPVDGEGPWTHALHGVKWFTSATTAQVAFTLARIDGQEGLSLFFVKVYDDEGALNRIRVRRLKDKLGTRALPTAELELDGTRARLVGDAGLGVKNISPLLNITRLHNALASCGAMRHALDLAWDYAKKRVAFGKPLVDHPLHTETLDELESTYEGCFRLTMDTAHRVGRIEAGTAAADEESIVRLLTPLVKLYTAKEAVRVASEVLESFGGAGYVEDTGLPKILRDAQVLTIWEGTTNVLSLDALRAVDRAGALAPFLGAIRARSDHPALQEACDRLQTALAGDPAGRALNARRLAWGLARTYAASLLAEAGSKSTLSRWLQEGLVPPLRE